MSRILCKDGDAERYLIDESDEPMGVGTKVRILDLERRKLSDPRPLLSVLNAGEWEAYTGDQRALDSLMAQVDEG